MGKIFTGNVEDKALEQIEKVQNLPQFRNEQIRIMPDVHYGAGVVIGFTSTYDVEKGIIPNVIGVDIGCGVTAFNLGKVDIDLKQLDETIKKVVPSGRDIHETPNHNFDYMFYWLKLPTNKIDTWRKSLGTLGGGNHFIELDEDEEGNKYLVVHSGSRSFGYFVSKYYQNKAKADDNGLSEKIENAIQSLKSQGRHQEIQKTIEKIKEQHVGTDEKELAVCYGELAQDYLNDMKIAQEYARLNRKIMLNAIVNELDLGIVSEIESTHNYMDDRIIRKGAISARKGETVIIPINMRDGSIIARGKGNADWNYSAPHGAGRIMSRTKAKEEITIDKFKQEMEGIYTTTATIDTIDESPSAYKNMNEILEKTKDTIEVIKIIKPIYNFKA